MSEGKRITVVLEGLALIQQQERDGDEVYVLVTPIQAANRGKTVRHPAPRKYWKLKESDTNLDPLIGPKVRPLQHTLIEGTFGSGDQLELAFWEEDFAPFEPDDPLTILTLHFEFDAASDCLVAQIVSSRQLPKGDKPNWIRPPAAERGSRSVGAARIVGKGCEYAAYLRFDPV